MPCIEQFAIYMKQFLRDRERFIREYEPVVRILARKVLGNYSGWFEDPKAEYEDLVEIGNIELIEIYSSIDFKIKGYKTYISNNVKWAMLNYIVSERKACRRLSLCDLMLTRRR